MHNVFTNTFFIRRHKVSTTLIFVVDAESVDLTLACQSHRMGLSQGHLHNEFTLQVVNYPCKLYLFKTCVTKHLRTSSDSQKQLIFLLFGIRFEV
jgi:hypothetical protein